MNFLKMFKLSNFKSMFKILSYKQIKLFSLNLKFNNNLMEKENKNFKDNEKCKDCKGPLDNDGNFVEEKVYIN